MTNHYNVIDHGARGDGVTLETQFLQGIIDRCFEAGGGIIYFPPGIYLTGTLFLKSCITIHLEGGAVLKASPNRSDYPLLGIWCEGRDTAMLVARDQKDICICGQGVIDGNGDGFFELDQPGIEADLNPTLVRQGAAYMEKPHGVEDGPVKVRVFDQGELRYGTVALFINCERLTFRDFRLVGAPNWALHLAGCRYATITNLIVRNSLLFPNADCIDIANSQHVTITGCLLEAGDDGIAITPCADGYHLSASEHIVVSNCTIISRSCAIRVGYGIEPLRNCIFSNLVIHSSNRGIGIFIRNGQVLENVLFSDIIIETRLHTGWWGNGEPIHISAINGYTEDKNLGTIRNIRFRNITARSENGILIYGADHPGNPFPIQDISFDGIKLEIVPGRLNDRYGGNIDLRPVDNETFKVFKSDLPGIYAKNVKGLEIRNCELTWVGEPASYFTNGLLCENCSSVDIDNLKASAAQDCEAVVKIHGGEDHLIRNTIARKGSNPFLATFSLGKAVKLVNNDLSEAVIEQVAL